MLTARTIARLATVILLLISLATWSQDGNTNGSITIDDILSLKSVSDPQIQPVTAICAWKCAWLPLTVLLLPVQSPVRVYCDELAIET